LCAAQRVFLSILMTDVKKIWQHCLQVIEQEISEQSFRTWFLPIVPARLKDKVLTIQVPSQFFYEWLEQHYVHLLKKAITAVLGVEGRLEYSIVVDRGNEHHRPVTMNVAATPTRKEPTPRPHQTTFTPAFSNFEKRETQRPNNLNKRYTFENFIQGHCNSLAYNASRTVASSPGKTSFNPLLIFGGVGLGKTHLVHAIGNEIVESQPDKVVQYISTERFTTEFVEALRSGSTQDFTNHYLQIDVLIVDDIEFLGGKEKTQESFFHIFNHLHQNSKQIIMTSDCPPRQLQGVQERLLSRFKWGLSADVQVPAFETRLAIIRAKIREEGLNIPPDVEEYIAKAVTTNVRELEGVLISLMGKASLLRKDIDLEIARQTIENVINDTIRSVELSLEAIQQTVADYFKVRLVDLKSATRKREIAMARQVAMFFCQEYTQLSLKIIGEQFGGRDHSTVIHAAKTILKKLETDEAYKEIVKDIKRDLNIY